MSSIHFSLSPEINAFGSIVHTHISLRPDCKETKKKNKCKRYTNRVSPVSVSYSTEVQTHRSLSTAKLQSIECDTFCSSSRVQTKKSPNKQRKMGK